MLSEAVHWVQSITLEGERLSAGGVVVRRDAVIGARLDTPGIRLSFIAMVVLLVVAAGLATAAFVQTLQFFDPDYSLFAVSLLPVIGFAAACWALRPRQHLSLVLANGNILAMSSKDRAFLDLCLEAFERLWTDPERSLSSLYIHAEHRSVDFGPAMHSAAMSRPSARTAPLRQSSASARSSQAPEVPVRSTMGPVPIPIEVPLAGENEAAAAPASTATRDPLVPGIDLPIFSDDEPSAEADAKAKDVDQPAEAPVERKDDDDGDEKTEGPGSSSAASIDPAQAVADAISSALNLDVANDTEKPKKDAVSEASVDERVAALAKALDEALIVEEADEEGAERTPEAPSEEEKHASDEARLAADAIEAIQSGEADSAETAQEPEPAAEAEKTETPDEADADSAAEADSSSSADDKDEAFKPIPAAAFDTVRSNVRTLARLLRQRSSSPALTEAIDILEQHTMEGCGTDRDRRALARSLSILRGRMTVYPAAIQVLDAVEVAAGFEDASELKASNDAA